LIVAGVVPPWQPPAVQGNSVWIVESEETGVSGLPRSLAAAANRVFVLNHTTLPALPVYWFF
jgi:hypothetical protein